MTIIDVAHVASTERLHDARDLPDAVWRHEQVHVIGHQHVCVDLAAFVQGDFAQIAPVAFVVARSEEARLSIVAALDDMLRDVRKIDARSAWHGEAGSSKSRRV